MRVVCPGWRYPDGTRVHEGELVLVEDTAHIGAPSTGICAECRRTMVAQVRAVKEA